MEDTFKLIEIDTADTLEELCEKEIVYIQIYNSHYMDGYGYNMTLGGEGTNGYIYTKEDKLKMSEMCKKYWESQEAREKCSEEQKKRFEENPEAKKEMSEIKKKYYEENPEVRKEKSKRMKKYYEENPDAKKEMSEIKKQYFEENPEVRQQMSERVKKYFENPDARRKMSDGKGQKKSFDVFKDGTFIKTFSYQYEAREYLQKEHNITSLIKIGAVLAGNRNSSAGFVFKYK